MTDSMDSTAKHLGPVWSVKWVERERGTEDREEVLISISHDGRVVQWTIRKGFEALVLLKVCDRLKRKILIYNFVKR